MAFRPLQQAQLNVDWPQAARTACTSARVISALCDVIDQGGSDRTAMQSEFPDLFPRPLQAAQLEAQQLGLPEPYIWDVE